MREFTPAELHQHLQDAEEAPLLLDVREPWEYEYCRIEGSRLLPMAQVPMALSQLDPAQETVVICHHGVRSFQVARFLEHSGFTNVINLAGGVDAWARAIDPQMKRY